MDIQKFVAFAKHRSAIGLCLAYRLHGSGRADLSDVDLLCQLTAMLDEPADKTLFGWAEVCASALRGETQTHINSLSQDEQVEIAIALRCIVEIFEKVYDAALAELMAFRDLTRSYLC